MAGAAEAGKSRRQKEKVVYAKEKNTEISLFSSIRQENMYNIIDKCLTFLFRF